MAAIFGTDENLLFIHDYGER